MTVSQTALEVLIAPPESRIIIADFSSYQVAVPPDAITKLPEHPIPTLTSGSGAAWEAQNPSFCEAMT